MCARAERWEMTAQLDHLSSKWKQFLNLIYSNPIQNEHAVVVMEIIPKYA